MNPIWRDALAILKERLDAKDFSLWIEPLQVLSAGEGHIQLAVPNKFYENWIRENHLPGLRDSLRQASGFDMEPSFVIQDVARVPGSDMFPERAVAAKRVEAPSAPLAPLSSPEPSAFSFENFIVGPSNRFAFAAAQGASSNPGGTYNPLFIYGGVGLGKTHLLRAVAHYCRNHFPHFNILYMTAEEFTNELISHIRQQRMEDFRAKYRQCDVLLIDDIQFIAGKERTQEEVFHTFNALYVLKKQIVIASDQIPREIPDLDDRLKSRFDWGLLADIQPPETETKVAIIEHKAEELKLKLSGEVAFLIASVPGASVRQIEGLMIRLGMHASLDGMPITPELARKVLKQVQWITDRPVTAEDVIKRVSAYFNVRIQDVKSSQRKKTLTTPRHVAMYLTRQLTSLSYPEIGQAFGGKDHATVMHAERKIRREMEADSALAATIDQLVDMLRN